MIAIQDYLHLQILSAQPLICGRDPLPEKATKPNNAYIKSKSNVENYKTAFKLEIHRLFDADARLITWVPNKNTIPDLHRQSDEYMQIGSEGKAATSFAPII